MSLYPKYLRTLVLFSLAFGPTCLKAAPFDDAMAAYENKDYSTAHEIWSQLADQNDTGSQYALGVMYATGNGQTRNAEKAFDWFRKAAGNGHVKAMYNLGIAYWTGQGTLEDQKEALHWWEKAAQRGDMVSQYNLGVAYYNGNSIERNFIEATRWVKAASDQGYEAAKELLPTLEEQLRIATPVVSEPDPAPEPDKKETVVADSGQPSQPANPEPDAAPKAVSEPDENSGTAKPANDVDKIIKADFTAALVIADVAPIYASNKNSAPVIEKLKQETPAKVVKRTNGWVKIQIASGFKMWAYGSYIKGKGDKARVSGKGVRARPLPSTAKESAPLGNFKNNDAVKLIKTEGKWKLVQAPSHLGAWIKSADLKILENPTTGWMDRWNKTAN